MSNISEKQAIAEEDLVNDVTLGVSWLLAFPKLLKLFKVLKQM